MTLTVPSFALADDRSASEIQEELDRARVEAQSRSSDLSDVRSQIGSTEEELAQITVRLEDARARLVAAEGQVRLAEEALVMAEADRDLRAELHQVALTELADVEAELEVEEHLLAEHVVGTFKYGSSGAQRGAMALEVMRRSANPNDFVVALKQLSIVIADQDATVTRVFDLRDEQESRTRDAAEAKEAAEVAARESAHTLQVVDELRLEAQAVADGIAQDERRQQEVLGGLRGTASETQALLTRVAARETELRSALVAAQAREAGFSDRSGHSGWAGGPDISGAVCPVQGARAGRNFINDWGYPRSGQRSHQGNDIFASRGTPVVAVADGVVTRMNSASQQTSLGGITVTYRTGDGSEWYNAHLDTIASGLSVGNSVGRGQQIGTVGNTGNARTTPSHLHLGRRYGGAAVNPFPTISGWC
ncbi:MAG: peptidoglycan DD-metalloendopeptidase family protein [Nitriliruptoraceae bacterium]